MERLLSSSECPSVTEGIGWLLAPLLPFKDGSDAETAAAADGLQAEACFPTLHFMEQGHQYARACAGNGVAQGDPRSVHVDPSVVLLPQTHLLDVCQHLGSKGLLDLNQLDIFDG